MGSAYNYRLSNLPVFNFLADLQHQQIKTDYNFDPSHYLPDLSHYPRVSYKNTILYQETWIWDKQLLDEFQKNESELTAFYEFSKKVSLCRYFALCSHDNQLVFDLNSVQEVFSFLKIIKSKNKIIIKEFFRPKNEIGSADQDGKKYISQYIASLTNNQPSYTPLIQNQQFTYGAQAAFLPGEEWLYFKIYVHPETANLLLTENLLQNIVNDLRDTGKLKCWFFVRYVDPEPHFRLRFQLTKDLINFASQYLTKKLKHLVKRGFIHDYSICTYHREIERYGAANIENVESFFERSSEVVVALYRSMWNVSDKEIHKLIFGLISVNSMLSLVIPVLSARQLYLKNRFLNMKKELGVEAVSNFELDKAYRKIRPNIEQAANDPLEFFGDRTCLQLDRLNVKFASLNIRNADLADSRQNKLIADLLHMHLNRIFSSGPLRYEMLCYYFLIKLYNSWIGKMKQKVV